MSNSNPETLNRFKLHLEDGEYGIKYRPPSEDEVLYPLDFHNIRIFLDGFRLFDLSHRQGRWSEDDFPALQTFVEYMPKDEIKFFYDFSKNRARFRAIMMQCSMHPRTLGSVFFDSVGNSPHYESKIKGDQAKICIYEGGGKEEYGFVTDGMGEAFSGVYSLEPEGYYEGHHKWLPDYDYSHCMVFVMGKSQFASIWNQLRNASRRDDVFISLDLMACRNLEHHHHESGLLGRKLLIPFVRATGPFGVLSYKNTGLPITASIRFVATLSGQLRNRREERILRDAAKADPPERGAFGLSPATEGIANLVLIFIIALAATIVVVDLVVSAASRLYGLLPLPF